MENVRLTSRTDKRGSRESSHGHTTLLIAPHIGQGTAHKRHRGREGDAINSTADDKGAKVLGNSTRDDKDSGHNKRRKTRWEQESACKIDSSCDGEYFEKDLLDDLPTVYFR